MVDKAFRLCKISGVNYLEAQQRWKYLVCVGDNELQEMRFRSILSQAVKTLEDSGYDLGSRITEMRKVVSAGNERYLVLKKGEDAILRCNSALGHCRDITIMDVASVGNHPMDCIVDMGFDPETKCRTYKVFCPEPVFTLTITRKKFSSIPITDYDADTEVYPDCATALCYAIMAQNAALEANVDYHQQYANMAIVAFEKEQKRQLGGTTITPNTRVVTNAEYNNDLSDGY